MNRRHARWVGLALTLAACGTDGSVEPAPEPDESESAHERAHEADSNDDDELRGPSGGAQVDCSSGSDDPEQIDLFALAAADGALDSAIRGLEALAGEHPSSSAARVRLGEVLLRTQPPRAASARTWFTRALELHERGCTLGYRDHWAALEGEALSHMMEGDYAEAIPPLEASIARWPGLRASHYNLACALCRTGDLAGCRREIETTLSALEAPSFLAGQARPVDHYRALVRRDPDLEALRADPAALEALLR